MVLLAAALVAIFLLLAQHPFVTYPLSLMLLRRRHVRQARFLPASTSSLRFAICMCAYNEESVVTAKCENLMALRRRHRDLEILAYVDGATDATEQILRRYEPAITVHASPERLGKTHGMNLLVASCSADIVIFTDADVMLDPEIPDRLTKHFADPDVGCVCGHVRQSGGGRSATAATGSLYWRLEEQIKQLESDLGSAMGADGSLFAIRRELHHPPPDSIIDDMYVSLMILLDGYRVVRAPDVHGYESATEHLADEFRRKIRIACQAFTIHRLLWPRLRRRDALTVYQYVSHKLLRWLCIFHLILAGAAAIALLAAIHRLGEGALIAGVGIAGLALAHRIGIRKARQLVSILAALTGTGIGVVRSLRGERFQTWISTSSLRGTGGSR